MTTKCLRKTKRLNQEEFRKLLLNKYKKCITALRNTNCIDELEACHIVEQLYKK